MRDTGSSSRGTIKHRGVLGAKPTRDGPSINLNGGSAIGTMGTMQAICLACPGTPFACRPSDGFSEVSISPLRR